MKKKLYLLVAIFALMGLTTGCQNNKTSSIETNISSKPNLSTNIYQEINKLKNKLNLYLLEEEKEELSIDIEKLRDPEYLSKYLKEKYFYYQDDEIIIIP